MSSEKVLFFLQDGAVLSERLGETLAQLRDEPSDTKLVHEAFRFVHSIKSEASFLGLDPIAAAAHEIENLLDGARRGEGAPLDQLLPTLFEMVERLEQLLFELEQSQAALTLGERVEHTRSEPSRGRPDGGEPPTRRSVALVGDDEDEPSVVLTDFEQTLLREARERQERFYRLACRIEDSAPIKYAKAYLVVSNLELIANVIRTVPSFDEKEDGRFGELQVLFTASVGEEELYAAADVDQVESVRIAELGFESLAEGETRAAPAEPKVRRADGFIRIDAAKLDDALEYVQEMKLLAQEIESASAREPVVRVAQRLEALIGDLRSIYLRDALRHLPRFARDLARSLGKRVQVELSGGDLVVDRRTLSLLGDPLLHLVRNAVDHGIEAPEERESLGKRPVGTIKVSAARKGSDLVLTVEDDGRGIDRNFVLKRARELGLAVPSGDADLLDLIVQPGFSTRHHATNVSGRGVGLDLVFNEVTRVLGGALTMESRVGRGSAFSLSVPASGGYVSVLLARCGPLTVGLPLRNVGRTLDSAMAGLVVDDHGIVRLGEMPVSRVGTTGLTPLRARRAEEIPAGHVVELSYLDTRSCLHVDELLFERDIPESNLVIERRAGSPLASVAIGGRRADFLLFRPGK